MTQTPPEPRNPFYLLLLLVSFLFVVTALAVVMVPWLEERARDAGGEVPDTGFHKSVRSEGPFWLLYEVAAMVVFGLLSMGLDRLRRLQKDRSEGTIPPNKEPPPSVESKG